MGTKSIGEDPPSTNVKAPEENFLQDSSLIDLILTKGKLIGILKKSDEEVILEKDVSN